MKNFKLILITCFISFTACKDENKQENNNITEPVVIENKQETQKTNELPSNIIQLNEDILEYPDKNFVVTKVQIENSNENKFLAKVFFKTDQIEQYQNGDYLLFIQNHPYENNINLLDDSDKEKGLQSLSVNLNSAKKYQDEYVLFRSFTSEILDFEKVVVGVMDLPNKQDVFRFQFDNASIKN